MSASLQNGSAGWSGGAVATCEQGAWAVTDASCVEIIQAACGSAAGKSTLEAPATALCAAGAPSAVAGDGPFAWTCAGQGGGADATCSANRSCAAATLSWGGGSCSAPRASAAHGASGALANTAAGLRAP
ncbi:MAG: hypothetical protein H6745_33795 [Deltaproteobacteria bacterium]|nr:hypothetical protein [Deltaproteobacteria bacterium]